MLSAFSRGTCLAKHTHAFRRWLLFVWMPFLIVLTGCESQLLRSVTYYESVGDLESARARIEATLQQNPADAEARFLYGRLHLNTRAYEDALAAFERVGQATARYDEQITFLVEQHFRKEFQAGVDAWAADTWDLAVDYLEHAVQLKPDIADAHRALGSAYVRAGNLTDAQQAYLQVLAVEPNDFVATVNLAELAFQLGDYEAALARASEALSTDPDYIPGLRRQALALVELDRLDEAAGAYGRLLELAPSYADRKNYAFLLFNAGRYQDVRPELEALADGASGDTRVLRALGETYFALGQYELVITVNTRLLNTHPNDRDAISNLVETYERMGNVEQARVFQDRLAQLGGAEHD